MMEKKEKGRRGKREERWLRRRRWSAWDNVFPLFILQIEGTYVPGFYDDMMYRGEYVFLYWFIFILRCPGGMGFCSWNAVARWISFVFHLF